MFRIGVSVKQQFTEEEIYKDRDSQISAIEKTFEDAQKPVSEQILVVNLFNPPYQHYSLLQAVQSQFYI